MIACSLGSVPDVRYPLVAVRTFQTKSRNALNALVPPRNSRKRLVHCAWDTTGASRALLRLDSRAAGLGYLPRPNKNPHAECISSLQNKWGLVFFGKVSAAGGGGRCRGVGRLGFTA